MHPLDDGPLEPLEPAYVGGMISRMFWLGPYQNPYPENGTEEEKVNHQLWVDGNHDRQHKSGVIEIQTIIDQVNMFVDEDVREFTFFMMAERTKTEEVKNAHSMFAALVSDDTERFTDLGFINSKVKIFEDWESL